MRDILFRGKRIDNGEWVYGYYVYTKDAKGEYQNFIVTPEWFIVDFTTIGQDTGLTDTNGKKIFEGDIVQYEQQGICCYGLIKYTASSARYGILDKFGILYTFNDFVIEVIANIHDNPELAEELK